MEMSRKLLVEVNNFVGHNDETLAGIGMLARICMEHPIEAFQEKLGNAVKEDVEKMIAAVAANTGNIAYKSDLLAKVFFKGSFCAVHGKKSQYDEGLQLLSKVWRCAVACFSLAQRPYKSPPNVRIRPRRTFV